MRVMAWFAIIAMGCSNKGEEAGPCTDVCGVLFDECQVASFGSFGECESSCAHAEESGADIPGYATCLGSVNECDTYEIVECENDYGW